MKPQSKQKKMGETQSKKNACVTIPQSWQNTFLLANFLNGEKWSIHLDVCNVSYQSQQGEGERKVLLRGIYWFLGFFFLCFCFLTIGVLPHDGLVIPLRCHWCHNHIFSPNIPNIEHSSQFFFTQWIVRGDESRAKNTITERVTLEECGLATGSYDGVPWLVCYLAETKGLWNHRKQNNQRVSAHSKKSSTPQKHNMIQDIAASEHLIKALAEQVLWNIS